MEAVGESVPGRRKHWRAEQGDAGRLAQLQANARAFWADWQQEAPALRGMDAVGFVCAANAVLQRHCRYVLLELEGAAAGADDACLVFSANGELAHFPQVQALLEAAPASGGCVRGFRRRAAGAGRELSVRMAGLALDAADIWVRCTARRERAALQVAFAKHIDTRLLPHARNMAFILLDHVVGEWDAAVKIGTVDFLTDIADDAVPLYRLPEQLDAFWRGLGRSGRYPQPAWQAAYYRAEADEAAGQDALALKRNEAAAALLGRADMTWCVSLSCRLDLAGGAAAAGMLEQAFYAAAEERQNGIGTLVCTHADRSMRTLYAVTAEPAVLLAKAKVLCARFKTVQAVCACEYDPTWAHYRVLP
ncbi:MAG: hypothetical protein Q4A62_01920 [Eikenella sp.]|nr:hypothetical protein [Eikenella sp.]